MLLREKQSLFLILLNFKWLPEWDDFRTFRVEILETAKNRPSIQRT